MFKTLVLVAAITVVYAEEVKTKETEAEPKPDLELNPAESAMPIIIANDDRHLEFQDGLELNRYREQRLNAPRLQDLHNAHDYDRGIHRDDHDDIKGPVILRTINPHTHGDPDIERQNRIIADVYSPDYYQPTWVLDYRYLKSGGRDYTRGPGGQILILPKNVRSNEPKEFPDYDSLLEHLRLSRLSQQSHQRRGPASYDAFDGFQHSYRGGSQERQEHQHWWNPYRQ